MITRKELGFVASWANRVPYPGLDYATIALEKLAEAIEYYNKYYNNKQYELVLSNGEQLSFEILNKNLCHLVGIDYKNLTGDYFTNYRQEVLKLDYIPKSYELLQSIIANMDDVLKYDYDLNGKTINYYRIMVKCAIFEKLSDFSRFNFGVINFDKDMYQQMSSYQISSKSNKFLYVQSNEPSAPYFMMGILPEDKTDQIDNDQDKYVAETLIAPTNTKDFFNNQEVVIPTQILVTTEEKMEKKEATPSEKIALLNQYKSIIETYSLPNRINIYGDYENMLASSSVIKKRTK